LVNILEHDKHSNRAYAVYNVYKIFTLVLLYNTYNTFYLEVFLFMLSSLPSFSDLFCKGAAEIFFRSPSLYKIKNCSFLYKLLSFYKK